MIPQQQLQMLKPIQDQVNRMMSVKKFTKCNLCWRMTHSKHKICRHCLLPYHSYGIDSQSVGIKNAKRKGVI